MQNSLPNNWQEYTIDSIKANKPNAIAMGPFGSNIKTDNFVKTGVPIIRGVNLSHGKLNLNDFVFLTDEKADELRSSNAFPKDLVFTHRGTLGQVGLIPEKPYPRYVVSQSQMKLSVNIELVNPLYLYYYFKAIGNRELLKHVAGAGVPAIANPLTTLKKLTILLPPLIVQKQIASILSSFDDKIELNNKISKILEEMAQVIFKEWFINFRFPEYEKLEFVDSELGKIPEGWKSMSLGKVSINLDRKRRPLSTMERSSRKGGFPYYGATEIMDYIDDYIFDGEHLLIAEDGSVETDEGKAVLQFIEGKFWVNNHSHIIQGTVDAPLFYLYLILKNISIKPYITGAVQLKLTQDNLNKIPVLIPLPKVMNRFTTLVYPMILKIRKLNEENQKLAALRDLLLPKLMKGEIRV